MYITHCRCHNICHRCFAFTLSGLKSDSLWTKSLTRRRDNDTQWPKEFQHLTRRGLNWNLQLLQAGWYRQIVYICTVPYCCLHRDCTDYIFPADRHKQNKEYADIFWRVLSTLDKLTPNISANPSSFTVSGRLGTGFHQVMSRRGEGMMAPPEH